MVSQCVLVLMIGVLDQQPLSTLLTKVMTLDIPGCEDHSMSTGGVKIIV